MKLDIRWSQPYKVHSGASYQWRREWCIQREYLTPFFNYWKKNKFKLLGDGFTVTKSDATGEWFLLETKDQVEQFKNFSGHSKEKPYVEPHPGFLLPEYHIQNTDGLRTWQVDAAGRLCSALNSWGAAIDGSDTGTGKTYTACAVAREMNLRIFVICPKAVMKSWKRVILRHFKLKDKYLGVINYEKLRTGRTDSPYASYIHKRHSKRAKFTWKLPKRTLIIWDESQKLKNWSTKNAKMCVEAQKAGYPMLFCSATNATNPLELRAVGLALRIFKGQKGYYEWAYAHGVYKGNWGLEFNNSKLALKRLHHTIFDQRGVRLRRDTIPGFPECEIISEAYDMDKKETDEINAIYEDMERELMSVARSVKADIRKAEKKEKEVSQLVIQLRARQKIELIKVPLMVDMVEEALEQGFSVAVFVNFTETLNALAKRLNTTCVFDGKTPDKTRDDNVDKFQEDSERVIIVNIQSGGAGLNLHDLNGKFPRMSIISPSYSPVFMRQALGRIWRDDAKTKAVQKIVCVANTVEENVRDNVQQKLDNLDMLNDGDLAYAKNYEIIND